MKNQNGAEVADIVFSSAWQAYLSFYQMDTTPDDWFLKTVAQAFDALPAEAAVKLLRYLVPVELPARPSGFIPRRFLPLYDAMLEPYFLRRFSIVVIKAVFTSLLATIEDRSAALLLQQNALSATGNSILAHPAETARTQMPEPGIPATDQEATVIDISGEEQQLSWNDPAGNGSGTDDSETGDWRLGNTYGPALGLTQTETDWLNKFLDPSNAFIAVGQCCVETIRLYLACLKGMDAYFGSRQSSLQEQVDRYAEGMTERMNVAVSDAYAIRYFREQAEANIYLTFFKKAENGVREAYYHKRRINDGFTYNGLAQSFERRFGAMAAEIIRQQRASIRAPDTDTEIQLNRMNTARWRSFFDEWMAGLTTENAPEYAMRIDALAAANAENPSVEHIHYEACKAFTGIDNVTAVKFYLKYLHADLHSEEVNSRQLNKGIQKRLFQSEAQLKAFEIIANELLTTGDLVACLQRTENLYATRRKKLAFDKELIDQIRLQHQATVDQLGEWLNDDELTIRVHLPPAGLPAENATTTPATIHSGILMPALNLSADQKELLLLFGRYQFRIDVATMNQYARSKGLFRNALIERINDGCYSELDDVLIEETGNGYEVNEFYYNKIINRC